MADVQLAITPLGGRLSDTLLQRLTECIVSGNNLPPCVAVAPTMDGQMDVCVQISLQDWERFVSEARSSGQISADAAHLLQLRGRHEGWSPPWKCFMSECQFICDTVGPEAHEAMAMHFLRVHRAAPSPDAVAAPDQIVAGWNELTVSLALGRFIMCNK